MEKIDFVVKKIMFNKSGKGKISPRIAIPILWVNEMGFSESEKEITMQYDEEKKIIILKKKE